MPSTKSPTISIKLLIHNERNCVILAEVGNDFVDTLRSLLTFPLGNIARLAAKHQCLQPGCLINLYNSVENLSLNSFRTDACKRMLLYPRNIRQGMYKNLKLNMMDAVTEPTKYFLCESRRCREGGGPLFGSYYETSRCSCGSSMNKKVDSTAEVERVAVKDEAESQHYKVETKFFITDGLRVMQGLPGGLVNFLLELGIKNVNQVEEKVVEIGSQEMSDLLSYSLVSKTTLTDVFLRKQGFRSSNLMHDERFMHIAPSKNERSMKDGKTSVNVMLRKSDRRILYAEAGDDFVNLLFTFLTIPLESLLELLVRKGGNLTVGSISTLLKDLDSIFPVTKQNHFEKGVLPPFYSCPNELPDIRSRDPPAYHCMTHDIMGDFYYLTSGFSHFEQPLKTLELLDPKSPEPNTGNSSGFVEKNSWFVVTDDLVIKPLSSVSSISLLKEIVVSLEDVEQQVITIGEAEALSLLRACLCTSSALSSALVQ